MLEQDQHGTQRSHLELSQLVCQAQTQALELEYRDHTQTTCLPLVEAGGSGSRDQTYAHHPQTMTRKLVD